MNNNKVEKKIGEDIFTIKEEQDSYSSYTAYLKNGQLHREDGPAVEHDNGTKEWFKNGLRHRDGDLPAIEHYDGTKVWFQNGQIHRDGDSHAFESHYEKKWYKKDFLHRENGPAVEDNEGNQEYYFMGNKFYSLESLSKFSKSKESADILERILKVKDSLTNSSINKNSNKPTN
jgi:hypothetical protein